MHIKYSSVVIIPNLDEVNSLRLLSCNYVRTVYSSWNYEPHIHKPYHPSDSHNPYYQKLSEAGSRGGRISKIYSESRLTLIARLVQNALYNYPLNIKLYAPEVAEIIHDEFESTVVADKNKYGPIGSFGEKDKTAFKPYLSFLVKNIRKLVKRGLTLIKSCAKEWHPTPGFVSA